MALPTRPPILDEHKVTPDWESMTPDAVRELRNRVWTYYLGPDWADPDAPDVQYAPQPDDVVYRRRVSKVLRNNTHPWVLDRFGANSPY